MKTELKVKFLQFFLGKKKDQNEGFTLIELLVVVIIIGVLAAVALPNLLGQVGKARESEAKNVVGALNRAQQARFTEKGAFTAAIAELEVPVGKEDYYNVSVAAAAVQLANGKGNPANGTRDYAGGVQYDQKTRAFDTIMCRANNAQG
ncbi:prepilin-type N-terminal cleavage/methylation domain-containing protein, partial [Chroococcidiopsidales cyanobacterium LEGE 13417]|nr:prepilin-type N-terminal cleavage/methylation domain-containing protein [Chroococcidiopsidales cyanobacterium LEGE 13417]